MGEFSYGAPSPKIEIVQVSITTHCNRNCVWCSYGTPSRKLKHHNIEYLREAAVHLQGVGAIHITGGEPTLHPDFAEIAKIGRELFGCGRFTVETNGYGFRRDTRVADAVWAFDALHVSLYDEVSYPGSHSNAKDVEFLQSLLHGHTAPELFVGGPMTHKEAWRRLDGTCEAWNSHTVSYDDGLLYPCCVGAGPSGAVGIPLTENWRTEIRGVRPRCEGCVYGEGRRSEGEPEVEATKAIRAPTAPGVSGDLDSSVPSAPSVPSEAVADAVAEMRLLIKFPTRGRPELFLKMLKLYREMASTPELVTIMVVLDSDDPATNASEILDQLVGMNDAPAVTVRCAKHAGKIDAINAHTDDAGEWDVMLLASDDMTPVVDGYDSVIRSMMKKHFPDTDGVLWFNDGRHARKLNTLAILGRKYYERFGYIYHPEYKSLWCDNEFTDVAEMLGRQQYINTIIIRHDHWVFRARPVDDSDKVGAADWPHDEEVYHRHKLANFGLPGERGARGIVRAEAAS